jgi:hypothetical protein
MKEAYYFSHDSNARNDLKMVKLRRLHGLEGVGLFWCVVEMLREANDYMLPLETIPDICYELRITEEVFGSLFECELLTKNDTHFYTESLINRMKKREEISKLRAEVGKKGGLAKQTPSKTEANAKQEVSIKGKERKGNKSKVKEKKDSGSLALAELPVEIYSDELRDVWSEYERHRTEKRSKLTPTARVKAIKNLVKLSRGDPGLAVKVVEQSIANGWTGLFELKGNNGTSKTRETAQEWLREKELEGH